MADLQDGDGPGSVDDRSIDAEAEKLLRDIEGTSPFVLRTSYAPDDLDPSDVNAPEMDRHDEPAFEEEGHMEMPQVQVVDEVERLVADQQAAEAAEEHARMHRHRLRNTLIFVLVVLAVIGAVIGVFVWRNSIAPDVKPSDTESLITGTIGVDNTAFNPVDPKLIPDLVGQFGKKAGAVAEATQGKLVLDGAEEKAASSTVKSMRYQRNGTIVNATGSPIAQATLGLDEDKRLVYVYCIYDLDALGVADAAFSTLATDGTVAQSLLTAMGVDESAVPLSAVALPQDKAASISTTSDIESCEFSGKTGKKAPGTWELAESYNHSTGKTVGDNSVMRKMAVELR